MLALQSINVVLCKICYTLAKDKETCACGNVGVILDDEAHMHIYVVEIKTTQRAILYYVGDFEEVRRELLPPFSDALYVDYSHRHTPFYFKEYAKKSKEPRRTSTEYDKDLIKALDRHFFKTSDGNERFRRTALNNPKG